MILDKHFQWAQIQNINNSCRNVVSVHSTGAENQTVSLHTDLDFSLQFRGKKSVFNYTFHPQKKQGWKCHCSPVPSELSMSWSRLEQNHQSSCQACSKLSYLTPGSAGWYSHLTQESKCFGQLLCKISTIFVIFPASKIHQQPTSTAWHKPCFAYQNGIIPSHPNW